MAFMCSEFHSSEAGNGSKEGSGWWVPLLLQAEQSRCALTVLQPVLGPVQESVSLRLQ